ncbi:hypothetical protein [Clostridium botulinum]|uniref:hypothetical protein n=1 Tax=Clostridium botulinum TaxID=1491 RepID=UPI00016BAAAF|nr:hypothetical protein [Clostridium botulinum]EPS52701.1 hypothetical protein CFSAN002368_05213 [Clostridium botulinum A1 str. CFSAN002368]
MSFYIKVRRLIENILSFNLNLIIKLKNRIRKSLGEVEKIFDYNYLGLKLDVWRKYYVVK